MTNEMKLLTALCDALGFEVEEVPVMEGGNQRIQILEGGDLSIEFDYKLTNKVSDTDDELEAVRALANEFSKGKHEIMTLKYNGKSYTYSDDGVLEVANENI